MSFTVKDLAAEDRPREKLLNQGAGSLSDAELLAILIGSGNREETAIQLAQRILRSAGNNLNQLGKLSIHHLMSNFKGIGEAKAITIAAALELGKRRGASEALDRKKILCSRDIYNYFYPTLGDLDHEEFWVLFLNRANKVIDHKRISQGGIYETVVDPRIIYHHAISLLASGIALCHNHPSGNLRPSKEDDTVTRKIKAAAELLQIQLLDHLILCDKNYYSYADEGRL